MSTGIVFAPISLVSALYFGIKIIYDLQFFVSTSSALFVLDVWRKLLFKEWFLYSSQLHIQWHLFIIVVLLHQSHHIILALRPKALVLILGSALTCLVVVTINKYFSGCILSLIEDHR